jgi:hypothetical protein
MLKKSYPFAVLMTIAQDQQGYHWCADDGFGRRALRWLKVSN